MRDAMLQRSTVTEPSGDARSAWTLAAALLGFFVVTFDAVVVNVALPSIRDDLGGGISGLQWVVDGYTLMFAGLLLTSGAVADRVGARRAFGFGLALFVAASIGCGLAPSIGVLILARFVQGSAAAIMMPASMALISQAYPDARRRSWAVGMWAMGGANASSSAPVLGGLLSLASWRLIFFINVPVGDTIGPAHEIDIAPRRRDGALGRFVTIWDVRVGDDVFIRSFHGPDGSWYRATQATGHGRIRVAGVEHDVTFEPAPDADSQAIDSGYRAKYGRSSYVDAMVTPTATAATLRVVPNDKEQP